MFIFVNLAKKPGTKIVNSALKMKFWRHIVVMALLLLPLTVWAQYDKDVFSFRGRNALSEGRMADAVAQFNILARLDSTDHWTFFYRGIAKYNLGDIRGARADFNTAVRLNPVFTSGYHYRAITESRSGDYDAALKDLEKAISLRPGNAGLYFTRGVTYFLNQHFTPAIADFDRYIRQEPKDPSAYLNRGACHLFLKDTVSALKDYNKAIRLDRFEAEGYIRRGRLYAATGKSDEALADMDKAIELDTTNTLAYFNRALLWGERAELKKALQDLDKVLEYEPGNALTLYNRSLLYAQAEDYDAALADMDRVININPRNVLAYFNRAGFFVNMGRWDDALADYNKAIELYPDFAKAYLNRSWVELQLGMKRASKEDYRTAQQKVAQYRSTSEVDFADTTRKYNALLALDADFAKKDFDDEMLQHRDVDIRLKPLYKFVLTARRGENLALVRRYENPLLERFLASLPLPVTVTNDPEAREKPVMNEVDKVLYGSMAPSPAREFLLGLRELEEHQYHAALSHYDQAAQGKEEGYGQLYQAFYRMNRGVLRAEMIDFIASIESHVQTLSMDDKGTTRARVREQVSREYDYAEAIADMEEAARIQPGMPYIQFNLGNLYCLSSKLVEAIACYDKALSLYPYLGDAYFNRALVLIYLKDKEKGCIDLSRAGELGVGEAYNVISRYCGEEPK